MTDRRPSRSLMREVGERTYDWLWRQGKSTCVQRWKPHDLMASRVEHVSKRMQRLFFWVTIPSHGMTEQQLFQHCVTPAVLDGWWLFQLDIVTQKNGKRWLCVYWILIGMIEVFWDDRASSTVHHHQQLQMAGWLVAFSARYRHSKKAGKTMVMCVLNPKRACPVLTSPPPSQTARVGPQCAGKNIQGREHVESPLASYESRRHVLSCHMLSNTYSWLLCFF